MCAAPREIPVSNGGPRANVSGYFGPCNKPLMFMSTQYQITMIKKQPIFSLMKDIYIHCKMEIKRNTKII